MGLTEFERHGDEQLRPASPANHAIDGLLAHLEAVGFQGAPRSLGVQPDGRLRLTWVEGHSGEAAGDPDAPLASLGALLRAYHDAVEGYAPRAGLLRMQGAPRDGTLVCHNDVGPVNTVFRGGEAVALIDWDLAGLGDRAWDLAYAAWRSVPLYDDAFFSVRGLAAPDRPRRLRLLLDAYGLEERHGFTALIAARIRGLYDTARIWGGERAQPGWAEVWRDTKGAQWLRSASFAEASAAAWQAAIER